MPHEHFRRRLQAQAPSPAAAELAVLAARTTAAHCIGISLFTTGALVATRNTTGTVAGNMLCLDLLLPPNVLTPLRTPRYVDLWQARHRGIGRWGPFEGGEAIVA